MRIKTVIVSVLMPLFLGIAVPDNTTDQKIDDFGFISAQKIGTQIIMTADMAEKYYTCENQ